MKRTNFEYAHWGEENISNQSERLTNVRKTLFCTSVYFIFYHGRSLIIKLRKTTHWKHVLKHYKCTHSIAQIPRLLSALPVSSIKQEPVLCNRLRFLDNVSCDGKTIRRLVWRDLMSFTVLYRSWIFSLVQKL